MSEETDTMIPKARLDQEINKRKIAEEQVASLQTQLTESLATAASVTKERDNLTAQVEGISDLQSKLQGMQAELDSTKADSTAHRAMLESGIKDSSVRDFTMHQFNAHKAEAGEDAQDFTTWWDAQIKAPSAILKPFLATDGEAAAVIEAPAAKVSLSGEKGVVKAPATPSPYSPGSVASMSREEFQANKAELLKGLSVNSLF